MVIYRQKEQGNPISTPTVVSPITNTKDRRQLGETATKTQEVNTMKQYNLSQIMSAAWRIFRKGIQPFAVALRMAWANAKAHNAAKAEAGISEETHTWAGWKNLGYEVIHESKALYKAIISDPATKKGNRVACYFGASQVQPISA